MPTILLDNEDPPKFKEEIAWFFRALSSTEYFVLVGVVRCFQRCNAPKLLILDVVENKANCGLDSPIQASHIDLSTSQNQFLECFQFLSRASRWLLHDHKYQLYLTMVMPFGCSPRLAKSSALFAV